MAVAISQEAKDAIMKQFIECRRESLMKTPHKNSFERAFALCAWVVESFPVFDVWIPICEKFPEEEVTVRVLYKNLKEDETKMFYGHDNLMYWENAAQWDDVIAWRTISKTTVTE